MVLGFIENGAKKMSQTSRTTFIFSYFSRVLSTARVRCGAYYIFLYIYIYTLELSIDAYHIVICVFTYIHLLFYVTLYDMIRFDHDMIRFDHDMIRFDMIWYDLMWFDIKPYFFYIISYFMTLCCLRSTIYLYCIKLKMNNIFIMYQVSNDIYIYIYIVFVLYIYIYIYRG